MLERPLGSMKSKHVEDVEIDYDKIPHMMRLVTVKAMLEKMQTTLTDGKVDPDSTFDRMCRQIAENIGTMNDGINISGITDEIIKNQEWFTANLDYDKMEKKTKSTLASVEPTDNQKKCIESFKTN